MATTFTQQIMSDTPADLSSELAIYYANSISHFPDEAIYVYSIQSSKMVYASGFKKVMGYEDNEITLKTIFLNTSEKMMPFAQEINEAAIRYIMGKSGDLLEYSFTMETEKIHKDGSIVPMVVKLGVHSTKDGYIDEFIGRFTPNPNLLIGKVMRYSATGPHKSEFEDELSKSLFGFYAISKKEIEVVHLVSQGMTFKEIAAHLAISQSAVEKRILPLYKRFEVKSLTQLVSFCFENGLLPLR